MLGLAGRVARYILYRLRPGFFNYVAHLTRRNILFPARNLLLHHKAITVLIGEQSFQLAPEGAVPLDMWTRRYFERHELDFVLSMLGPGMTFIDVGANVGIFSIPAAQKVQNGQVFAFEPSHWTHQRLVKNAEINKLTNVHAVCSAVGDYNGEAVLQINVPGKDGLNTIGKPSHWDSDVVAEERVPITTLDDFVRLNAVSHVDVIKIDTEGAELLVLRGARDLLAKPNAPLILYEGGFLSKGFDYHPVESMWLLQQHGYSFFVINQASGKISIPVADRAYDAMVIAAKPQHPSYATLQDRAG